MVTAIVHSSSTGNAVTHSSVSSDIKILHLKTQQQFPPTAPPSPRLPSDVLHDIKPSYLRSESLPPSPHCNRRSSSNGKAQYYGSRPRSFVLPDIATGSSLQVMKEKLAEIDLEECDTNGENAFFICDLASVWRMSRRWEAAFGQQSLNVEAFFAVKSNPDPLVIRLLGNMGMGFDCASQAEIALVLSLGFSPDRIIYANPCKAASYIRHAAASGVDLMTFDNVDELVKVRRYHPRAKLVLRILTDDSGSLCRLGLKFGAPLSETRTLLAKACELDLNVVGVSFHVGSGCSNPDLYRDAIERARRVFNEGSELGYKFDFLDIGGGFQTDNFEAIAHVVHKALADQFPDGSEDGLRIIAEPGRYFVGEAFELATNIIARRSPNTVSINADEMADDQEAIMMYYINDGVYGAFNCTMFDHQVVHPQAITIGHHIVSDDDAFHQNLKSCSIWGPTCDSIDCVSTKTMLPTDSLLVGDWLRWQVMGAYTICAASQFNGFCKSLVHYTIDEQGEDGVRAVIEELLDADEPEETAA